MLTQRTGRRQRREAADAASLERGVRQLLADKISGNQVGIWLLLPEHLRLGTWDLVRAWTGAAADALEPRLALQVIHEAVLCRRNLRCGRTLSQKGFEVANGLPWVGSDPAIHALFEAHTVAEAQRLQINLGKLRRASGHFAGRRLVLDPHRLKSFSQRQMRRHRFTGETRPSKRAQTFFCLDADTHQPLAFTLASGARTVAQATPELLAPVAEILGVTPAVAPRPLVLADEEHYSGALFDDVRALGFDLLVPMKNSPAARARWSAQAFTPQWAGYALAAHPYRFGQHDCIEFVQRSGERPEACEYKGYLGTRADNELAQLTRDYPQRWHVEEFFHAHQALGWQRAGTLNLHVRHAQMSLALVAQALSHQFRQRLGAPYQHWDAAHLAQSVFAGLEGDVRVHNDTILVTYYNAPNAERLRPHYEGLPAKLAAEHINPRIPWLCDFQLDFRFK